MSARQGRPAGLLARERCGRALVGAATVLVAACGGAWVSPAALSTARLRARVAAEPNDVAAVRELAVAELLRADGDPARARPAIAAARRLSPDDERLAFAEAAELVIHGELTSAVEGYLEALRLATESPHPLSPAVAELSLAALRELSTVAARFGERVGPTLERVFAAPGRAGPLAREAAGDLLLELTLRRGELERARELSRRMGCPEVWRVAGPFGPGDFLQFDGTQPPVSDAELAAHYDLGPGRGRAPTRVHGPRACAVHLGSPERELGGVTYAEAWIEAPERGTYALRVETPNTVAVFVDGVEALRADRRREALPRVLAAIAPLAAGRHRVLVKLASRHPNPVLRVTLRPEPDATVASLVPPAQAGAGESPVLVAWLAALLAGERGDTLRAEAALSALGPDLDSAAFSVIQAQVASAHPLRAAEPRRDEARRLLRRARERDPAAWSPALELARLDAAEGRSVDALRSLREPAMRWPEVASIPFFAAELALQQGWDVEAARLVDAVRGFAPDLPRGIELALQLAGARDRLDDVARLSAELVRADARSDAALRLHMRRRDWGAAAVEIDRLGAFEPVQRAHVGDDRRLAALRGSGDEAGLVATLTSAAEARAWDVDVVGAVADQQLAAGGVEAASRTLRDALAARPHGMRTLRRRLRALGGVDELTAFRRDGAEVIRAFEASGRRYDEPQVLVLDYTVVRVFDDGSSLELTHNITRVQSQEAVDDQGEYRVPEGAELLVLRTVKADGRRIEPDEVAGKETISLPNLSPGDYVEVEHLQAHPAPQGFPGGYAGSRFYFQSFEVPFDQSELVVVTAPHARPHVDPRGPVGPPVEEAREGLRVLRWRFDESRPRAPEPSSVSSREFLPSVRVTLDATWPALVAGFVDQLADRDVFDPGAARLVARLVDGADGPRARAERIYRWVLANVEENGDVLGLAPAMLAGRVGSRARVLRYAFALAGLEAELVLAKSLAADRTPSDAADPETFDQVLVCLEGPRCVSTASRHTPFGYVPPIVRGQPAYVVGLPVRALALPADSTTVDGSEAHVRLTLRPDGGADVAVRERFTGLPAIAWREDLENIPAATLDQQFEEGYVARLAPGAELVALEVVGAETPDVPLELAYRFRVGRFGRPGADQWNLPPLFAAQVGASLASAGARTTAELLGVPIVREVTVELEWPEGYALSAAPPPVALEHPVARAAYRLEAASGARSLRLRRTVSFSVGVVEPSEYPAFADFCRRVDALEAAEVVLRRAARP